MPDFLDLDEIADERLPRIADPSPDTFVMTVIFFLVGLENLFKSLFFLLLIFYLYSFNKLFLTKSK